MVDAAKRRNLNAPGSGILRNPQECDILSARILLGVDHVMKVALLLLLPFDIKATFLIIS